MKEQAKKFKSNHKKVYRTKKLLYTKEIVSIENIIKNSKKIEKEIDVKLIGFKLE
jgi:hypothetical protein